MSNALAVFNFTQFLNLMATQTPVLILPGLYNSGELHWQTVWEKNNPSFFRVQQADWETPICSDWIARIDDEIVKRGAENVVLVGHSLACQTIIKWYEKYQRIIKGALIVAPSDVDAPSYPEGTQGFKPMLLIKLPFPSIVIASTNDIYIGFEQAQRFAQAWGSTFVNAGDLGHINSDSNLGEWAFGFEQLQKLL